MPTYTCSKCNKEGSNNSNMQKHVRTEGCRGATVLVTGRKRVFKGYVRKTRTAAPLPHQGEDDNDVSRVADALDSLAAECQGSFALLPAAVFRALGPARSPETTPESFSKIFLQRSVDIVARALELQDHAAVRTMVLEKTYAIAGRKYSVADAVGMYTNSSSTEFHMILPKALRSVVLDAKKTLRNAFMTV